MAKTILKMAKRHKIDRFKKPQEWIKKAHPPRRTQKSPHGQHIKDPPSPKENSTPHQQHMGSDAWLGWLPVTLASCLGDSFPEYLWQGSCLPCHSMSCFLEGFRPPEASRPRQSFVSLCRPSFLPEGSRWIPAPLV